MFMWDLKKLLKTFKVLFSSYSFKSIRDGSSVLNVIYCFSYFTVKYNNCQLPVCSFYS